VRNHTVPPAKIAATLSDVFKKAVEFGAAIFLAEVLRYRVFSIMESVPFGDNGALVYAHWLGDWDVARAAGERVVAVSQ